MTKAFAIKPLLAPISLLVAPKNRGWFVIQLLGILVSTAALGYFSTRALFLSEAVLSALYDRTAPAYAYSILKLMGVLCLVIPLAVLIHYLCEVARRNWFSRMLAHHLPYRHGDWARVQADIYSFTYNLSRALSVTSLMVAAGGAIFATALHLQAVGWTWTSWTPMWYGLVVLFSVAATFRRFLWNARSFWPAVGRLSGRSV